MKEDLDYIATWLTKDLCLVYSDSGLAMCGTNYTYRYYYSDNNSDWFLLSPIRAFAAYYSLLAMLTQYFCKL